MATDVRNACSVLHTLLEIKHEFDVSTMVLSALCLFFESYENYC